MRIDAHQHYWQIERGDYGWITPETPLMYRDYLPADLEKNLSAHNIDGTILVQAAATLAESEYILQLAEETPSVLGVVGWIDLFDPQHRQHWERLSRYSKLVGFRIMIQDMPDAACVLEESFVSALQSLAAEGVRVDLLLTASQFPVVVELLKKVPALHAVVDHLAKPQVASWVQGEPQQREQWMKHIEEIASHPQVYCKLSGLVTEANHESWQAEQLVPYMQHVLKQFGVERVMFGSDWPVCLLAATYNEVVDVLEQAIPAEWGAEERALLFGQNARRFYQL